MTLALAEARRAETAGSEAERRGRHWRGPIGGPNLSPRSQSEGDAHARFLAQGFPQDHGGCGPRRRRGARLSFGAPRPGRRHRQGRRAPLAVGHHGHQRSVAPRRLHDGVRGDQRQGRGHGQEDRARGRRSRVELGPLRREGQAAPASRQGRGHLRLLDLGQPQVGAAGVREQRRPALLPRAVRG